MPEAFERCRKKGGKIRTRTLSGGRYQYICILNGEVYPGEIHKKKNKGKKLKKALRNHT